MRCKRGRHSVNLRNLRNLWLVQYESGSLFDLFESSAKLATSRDAGAELFLPSGLPDCPTLTGAFGLAGIMRRYQKVRCGFAEAHVMLSAVGQCLRFLEWAAPHRGERRENWRMAKAGELPRAILPLE